MKALYKLTGGGIVLATACKLKYYYSHANSEDLDWIIGPTAFVAELFTDLSFSPEPGYGWVDVAHSVVLAPVCAGVNFLIIAFCMSSFQILWKKHSPNVLVTGIVLAATASYLLTIFANAMRIVLAVILFTLDIYSAWLTPDMVHRVAGIVVYYLLLCLYSQAVNWSVSGQNNRGQMGENPFRKQALRLVPLFWYVLLSVGVPLAYISLRADPELFLRHAATVGAVTAVLTLILYKAQRWYLWVIKDRYNARQPTASSLE
ncbi:MAG: exosortase K [Desulfofustis sp.]|nr:exosortase K [Desulfofustis sp.]